jgi:L-2-hydroxyglutarate oxidase LhgO
VTPPARCDIAVIGAGIVGLATALSLADRPGLRLAVLEKEAEPARHQTGRNSGVIHSGIYYRPGSDKARLCVEGARLMHEFCDRHGVPVLRCGKVIVATDERELPRLDALFERGLANNVPRIEKIGPERLREIEPHAAGIRAIYSPATSSVDFARVARVMAQQLAARGIDVLTSARVTAIRRGGDGFHLETPRGDVRTRYLVNCAGLHADRVARLAGVTPDVRLLPFRGEYYTLRPERRDLVRGLIYPVPDPRFPFLGVHLTRTVHGAVEAGPNAVLALAREGYSKKEVSLGDLAETLTYGGFWRMARRYWRTGAYEVWRSLHKGTFVRALRRLVPDLRDGDVERGGAGVRAQAIDAAGLLVDDFRIVEAPGAIHVINAPSPAATASLAIGRRIAHAAATAFGLEIEARR